MFKSVLSVFGGYLVMVVATLVLFAALGALAPDSFGSDPSLAPGVGILLVILAAGLLCAIGGGWATARWAPRAPWMHVVALVGLLVVMSLVTMGLSSEQAAPAWYQVGLGLVGVGGALLGGRLWVTSVRTV